PLPRLLAMPGREQDAVRAEEPGRQVAERNPRLGGCAVLLAGDADDAAHALRDEVVAAARRVRSRAAEARDGAVDEARIEAPQRVVVDAETAGRAGPVILHEDVGRANQPMHHLDALGRLEVERDPALVAVDGHERAAVAVAAG